MILDSNSIKNDGRVLIRKEKVKRKLNISRKPENDPIPQSNCHNCQQKSEQPMCIKIAHVNINGINSKLDSLQAELSSMI